MKHKTLHDVQVAIVALEKDFPWFENLSVYSKHGMVRISVSLDHCVAIPPFEDPMAASMRLLDLFQQSIDEARKEIYLALSQQKEKPECPDS